MITPGRGDLLEADTEAIVNTVNCVGVMGKGIALQVKRRYPNVFKAYERACKKGEVEIGKMHVVPTGELTGPAFVINFPTKKHWRGRSRVEYIARGLDDLRLVLEELQIGSVAVPPLGTGNGGLDWRDVEPLIRSRLSGVDCDIRVYPPVPGVRPVAARPKLSLTWGRALLLELLGAYVERRRQVEPWEDHRGASHLELQKLLYFANALRPDLKLNFAPGRYGPYSDRVRHLIQEMEGYYLTGYGDGSSRALALEPIAATPLAIDELARYAPQADAPDIQPTVDQVMATIDGFEDAYGLELLASTHWVAAHEGADGSPEAAAAVRGWTQRKGRIFTDEHVASALVQLRSSPVGDATS